MSLKHQGLFLLTTQLYDSPTGGREKLCRLNRDALSAIFGDNLIVFELPRVRPRNLGGILRSFQGYIDGLTAYKVKEACRIISQLELRRVFVDGSNLGGFVRILKRTQPEIEVITFFHNVEARFFWGSFSTTRSLRALLVFVVNCLAERKAARLSDKRICLSERDSRILHMFYGHGATHIAPMALEDKLSNQGIDNQADEVEQFALFVGGDFYANIQGIKWFSQQVCPRISIKIYIVGKGMERLRGELELPGKVEVIGLVDDLNRWYKHAKFVIAPIFDGSGMKTKIAEALMFGKKVVGTPAAFSGYEDIVTLAGWSCNTRDEFVEAIEHAQRTIKFGFDPVLRDLYEKKYSLSAATARLSQILLE